MNIRPSAQWFLFSVFDWTSFDVVVCDMLFTCLLLCSLYFFIVESNFAMIASEIVCACV